MLYFHLTRAVFFSLWFMDPLGVMGQLQRKWGLICENSLGVHKLKWIEKILLSGESPELWSFKMLKVFFLKLTRGSY